MSTKVTFSQLIEELAEQTNSPQTLSHNFATRLTDLVIDSALESGKASITNLGSFTVVDVAARNGVNPQTGDPIVIPAHQRLSFSPYKALENTVNAPFANLEATIIEEEEATAPVFKNPKKETGGNNSILIATFAALVFTFGVIGVWFFFFRDNNIPEIAHVNPTPLEQPIQTPPVEDLNSVPPLADEVTNQSPITEETIDNEIPPETGLVENAPLGTNSHIVTKGEWFYDIARNTYKIPTFWPLIFEANFSTSEDPDILKPGKMLNIPSIENPQNPTLSDRNKLSAAAKIVSEAYTNAGKIDKAAAYERMAKRFSN